MKVCKALILLSLFMVAFYNCAPPPDEDTGEDTTTAELPWTGETDKFTINTKEGVHLNDPEEDAGTAYITFPSSSVHNTRWEFGVRLTFNPSANNYARFYLTSSSNVLSGELTGYFIQIGGAKDNVALYRQNGAELKLLASGRELMKGNNSPKLSGHGCCQRKNIRKKNRSKTAVYKIPSVVAYTVFTQRLAVTALLSIIYNCPMMWRQLRNRGKHRIIRKNQKHRKSPFSPITRRK